MSNQTDPQEKAQQNLLRAFGQAIKTPNGDIRGIFRDTVEDAPVGRKAKTGLTLSLTQPVLHVTPADAQRLSPGQAITINGQRLVIQQAQKTALGLLRYPLVPATTGKGPWR